MLAIVVIKEASSSPLSVACTPEWLARACIACGVQLIRDVAPVYGGTFGVRVGAGLGDIKDGEMVFAIVDSLPQDPGAVAYHSNTGNDVPVGFLALSTCNSLDDVSLAMSHEFCETAGDEYCSLWADTGIGTEWALEICDPVESSSYPMDVGDGQPPVQVSDFVLPAFWGPSAVGQYSQAQAAKAPFTCAPGGYAITRETTNQIVSLRGECSTDKLLKARHWSSRAHKRKWRP